MPSPPVRPPRPRSAPLPAWRCWRSPPASQNGTPSARNPAVSTLSRSPYIGSPDSFNCSLPRGGALWPPAVGPSTTNPSTFPLARRSSVAASVCDETIATNRGRISGVSGPSAYSAGSSRMIASSPCPATAPVTDSLYSASHCATSASRTPGMCSGIPAPISTYPTPASIAP